MGALSRLEVRPELIEVADVCVVQRAGQPHENLGADSANNTVAIESSAHRGVVREQTRDRLCVGGTRGCGGWGECGSPGKRHGGVVEGDMVECLPVPLPSAGPGATGSARGR